MTRTPRDDPDGARDRMAGPRAVVRVLDILQLVSTRSEGCTLTEVAGSLGLPKTSTFSLLKTLEGAGYLRLQGGRYLLATEAIKLGTAIGQAVAFPRCTRPVLERLARETGETIMLAALSEEGHEITYLDIIESDAPLRFTVRVGNRRPLYCAAAGKAILAFLPAKAQRSYLRTASFVRFTAETSGKEELAALLPQVHRQAVVTDANGIVDGAAGIASPCFDGERRVVCAVAIAGPTARLMAQQKRLEALTFAAGEEISRILGLRDAYPPPAAAARPTGTREDGGR